MNIGLVLSGGMAKGAYQIGALKALAQFVPNEEIKYISCASIGVLNGYAYITGKIEYAEELWRSLCDDSSRLIVSRILRSTIFQQNILKLYDESDILTRGFYASLLDIENRNIVYKDLSSVKQSQLPLYLKASVAMPIYNHSVSIDGFKYFDGAMIDNIPVFPLAKHNLDYIVCMYFDDMCYKFENTNLDNRIIRITFPCEDLVKQHLILRKECIAKMINVGFEETNHLLKYIFAEGYDNLEYVYNSIMRLNEQQGRKLRITGDVLVTNLNKLTQKIAKRKIR